MVVSSGKNGILDISIDKSPPEGILFSIVKSILADCIVDLILFRLAGSISGAGVLVTEIKIIGSIITSNGDNIL